MFVDGVDRYARAVMGAQPENFRGLVGYAQELLPVALEACGVDDHDDARSPEQRRADQDAVRDTLLLAAWTLTETANGGSGENPVAFVQRAKQVIGWCQPKTEGLSVLEHMENKARELARMIGQRLFRHEGFVLLVFDQNAAEDGKGSKGHVTWITSVQRRMALEIVGDFLEGLKADQASRS